MRLGWTVVVSMMLASAVEAFAGDHPVNADRLRILDKATGNSKRFFYFRAEKEANVNLTTIADPTIAGATLEVFGTGAGDGTSGALTLPAENWRKLTGSLGYYYRDHAAVNGASQIWLKRGGQGGLVWITARGPAWTYQVTQPQTAVVVRLTVGGERYCAKFTDMQANRPGIVFAKKNGIVADCNL